MAEPIWLDRLEATRPYQWLRQWMNRSLINFLVQGALAGRRGLRLAEVACGSGFAAHLLATRPEVSLSIAADLNLDDYTQANISGYAASFLLTDLFAPALQANSLDLVWNSSSIEEIDRPQQAVACMAALAKHGGLVFVGVPSRQGIAGLLRLLPSARTRAWLGRVYSRAELRGLLAGAGLHPVRETSYLFGTFIGLLAQKPRS
ncbi:MAG: methyltransferase domain-containing protein [Anaerolineales bacterium]|nr:MAG: methyltransferase domain-containing protein [Anaerolineales bacterium]